MYYRLTLALMIQFGLFNTLLVAQNVLVDNDFSWSVWEYTLPDDVKLKIINEINDELITEINNSALNSIKGVISNFHVIDFNFDGYKDVIYHGFAGTESDRTVFFINNQGNFTKILDLFGEIVEMRRDEPYLPLSFKLIDYPCCENYTYSVETYVPTLDVKGNFRFKLSNKINYIRGTEFPLQFYDKPILFNVVNEKYALRSSPVIDSTSSNDFIDMEGNAIAEYTKGTIGIALADKEDNTGRIWWFVIVFNNTKPLNTIFHSGNNPGDYYSFGWMSSRYLEKIK